MHLVCYFKPSTPLRPFQRLHLDSSDDLRAYFDDFDWDDFNHLSLDNADIENDMAAFADQRVQATFDAAQESGSLSP